MTGPQPEHVGHATLELLREDYSVPIMRALMDGTRRPSDLERRLPEIPHAALMRHLRELRARGLVQHVRYSGLSPTAEYTISSSGRVIVSVVAAAVRWERARMAEPVNGSVALKLMADERTREVLLVLAPGALTASALRRQVSMPRTALLNRLSDLLERGILARDDHHYRVTDSARDLMLVATAAGRWEWEFAPPPYVPKPANVVRAVHLYAPKAQLAADLRGNCTIHVDTGYGAAAVALAADGRALSALASPPDDTHATCQGPPGAWCDGLLLGRWRGVVSHGDRALMAAILGSLAAALIA